MAAKSIDPQREAHKSWLGLIQPVGLVVSPPALVKAQLVLDRNTLAIQQALQAVLVRRPTVQGDGDPRLLDVPRFARDVLGWSLSDLAGCPEGPPLSDALCLPLPDYGETLRPTYAAYDPMAADAGTPAAKPILLVQVLAPGTPLDKVPSDGDERARGWSASPLARFERLLRATSVPAGLLLNGDELRLVYAPRNETSGHLGFPIAELGSVHGRPLLAALHMLLCEHRVFSASDGSRLLDVLSDSRKYQSEVSTRLSEQVLGALWELLRGFQAADEASGFRLLSGLSRSDDGRGQIYGGLLTVIMRLVFLLYAEDQGLLPDDPVFARGYAIGGLFERLREDAGRYPDTMDQRFGAYAWLLATFRLIFDGGGHGDLHLPTRHGQLFNPDEYPFLEGRQAGDARVMGGEDPIDVPRVSDGVIWRVLDSLLMLDGERLSYRALDVEQVGSVYESMMGFSVCSLPGRAIALRPKGVVVDLDALLAQPAAKRAAYLKDQAECDLSAGPAAALRDAKTIEDLVDALSRRVAQQTPQPQPPGALFLQPGEERRRSGSHYTPRELTAPIVQTTLAPIVAALGDRPRPEQILDLAVCDPAMGSGAFLVETCRQLATALVNAWDVHACTPTLPPDEDPHLFARRLIAQRCLYGVDKNPFAVNLAKLSLWLATLARDHAFTFLDHALKHGDSLVGLTDAQIGAFHWSPPSHDFGPLFVGVTVRAEAISGLRKKLWAIEEGEGDYDRRRLAWREAEDVVSDVRRVGDLCLAAFFAREKDKDREALRGTYQALVRDWQTGGHRDAIDTALSDLHGGDHPICPLHWEIEFPEVFRRKNPGFDAIVGNPPFAGKNTIAASHRATYPDWLKSLHAESHGAADLVAHFFRRAFTLLRDGGTLGLIATNTIAQGDTRSSGLRWICTHGGAIYHATRRYKWPGLAAVIVSVVHIQKGASPARKILDGREVPTITAFLFHGGSHEDPNRLLANANKSFQGSIVLGMGFTFDDTNPEASPISEMNRLIAKDPRNQQRIFPYIGGEEVNSSPTHSHHRYVINFGELTEEEARRWPDLMRIVEEKVKPARLTQNREIRAHYWWRFGETTPALFDSIANLRHVLAITRHQHHWSVSRLDSNSVFADSLVVFPLETSAAFMVLQSRIHEIWARFFGSSMKDDLRYTPSDCFETFPFPPGWESDARLEEAGRVYYEFRAALMVRNDEGLTKTYNRFHDPNERDPDILKLRALHADMDRAVLAAYGWTDIATDCDFYLDYEIDEASWGDKKKPYRYRFPDAVRDDLLARLLDLNQARYREEVGAGLHGTTDKPPRAAARPGRPAASASPRTGRAKAAKAGTSTTAPLSLFPVPKDEKP
ncbi:MAG: N-6 DNA methylase [Myxococcales bacterium]|nr:N-6 DNA methylase [Myxococcales bacterium]